MSLLRKAAGWCAIPLLAVTLSCGSDSNSTTGGTTASTTGGSDGGATAGGPKCGDMHVDTGEECDDGNANDRDGCTSKCVKAVCGDGIVQPNGADNMMATAADNEECDDGNAVNGDGCNACKAPACGNMIVDPGEACDGTAGCTVPVAGVGGCKLVSCGDGIVQAPEACDDMNTINTDGCTNNCTLPVCGDGIVNGMEACDDGNKVDNDACTNKCTAPICGDGIVQTGEGCDDGNMVNTDTCPNNCKNTSCGDGIVNGADKCDDGNMINTDACTNNCTLPVCGDGIVNGTDVCDDGNMVNNDSCPNNCKAPVCGDGIVNQASEGCDDGNMVDTDGCTNKCTSAQCGDGVVQAPEMCDDGNKIDNDACSNLCRGPSCGDGIKNGTEECDDGNTVDTDGCRNTCLNAKCGDGVVGPNETCDDGAANNGPGKRCSSACTLTACGNKMIDPGEECDDGNQDNTDSCLTNCLWNKCGDGAVYVTVSNNGNPNMPEQCDDGNQTQTDSCLNSCKYNTCADGFKLSKITWPYTDPDGTGPMTATRGSVNLCGTAACVAGPNSPTGSPIPTNDVTVPAGFVVTDINLEQCDDGNMNNNDSCVARNADADPQMECMFAICGDGFTYNGATTDATNPAAKEDCDDHDVAALTGGPDVRGRDNTDSCLDTCKWNACHDGFQYVLATEPGNTNALEACDDGNSVNTDACVGTCALATCGDGFVNAGVDPGGTPSAGIVEQCDDADGTGAGDNCDATLSGRCTIKGAAGNTCGNGVLEPGEQCDDGNAGAPVTTAGVTIGCGTSAMGYPIFAALVCNGGGATPANTACAGPVGTVSTCGAGGLCVSAGKNGLNTSCTCNCMWNKCGDGQNYLAVTNPTNPNPLEVCDDGNSNNRDTCLNACVPATCGDGFAQIVGGFEACDDGNAVNNDGCTNACVIPTCGDGIVQAGEECDDGNASSTDSCLSNPGVAVGNPARTCKNAVCGDLFIGPNESCDNGVANGAPGNTCRANCVLTTCGNGVNDGGGEQCDDGNTSNNDLCTNACLTAKCGDGFVSPTEQCDDANVVNTDSCTNLCKWNACGDGVRYTTVTNAANPNPVEACDQGLLGGGFPNALAATTPPGGNGGTRDDTFNDAGDGMCTDNCKLECFPNRTWATTWKSNTYCLFMAEPYGDGTPGAPYNAVAQAGPNPRFPSAAAGAEAYCQGYGIGAHLAKLTSAADNTLINTVARATALANGTPVWLGLVDRWKEDNAVDYPGSWHWISDNSAVSTFTNWDQTSVPPQPDDRPDITSNTPGQEDCGVFYIGAAASSPVWHDWPCATVFNFACEFPLPAPGSP